MYTQTGPDRNRTGPVRRFERKRVRVHTHLMHYLRMCCQAFRPIIQKQTEAEVACESHMCAYTRAISRRMELDIYVSTEPSESNADVARCCGLYLSVCIVIPGVWTQQNRTFGALPAAGALTRFYE